MADRTMQFTITAEDRSRAAIQSALRGLGHYQTALKHVERASQQHVAAQRQVGAAVQASGVNWQRLGQAMKGIQGSLATTGAAFAKIGGVMKNFLGIVGRLVGIIGGALLGVLGRLASITAGAVATGLTAVAGAMSLIARAGVGTNIALQRTEAGLTVLLRSSSAAKGLLRDLKKEAASSAFEFTELAELSKKALAFGFSKQQVIPLIRTLGDAAAGLTTSGDPAPMLDRLLTTFGQIRAKGTLSGEEGLQLTEAGLNPREMLGIRGDIGDAKLSSQQAIPALLQGIQKRFGGLQAQSTQSIPGLTSNIKDAFADLSSEVTTGLTESIRKALANLLQFLQTLRETGSGQRLLAGLTNAFNGIGTMLERLSANLPQILERVQELWDRFKAGALQAADLTIRTIRGLAGAFTFIKDHAGEIWTVFKDGLKDVESMVKKVGVVLASIFVLKTGGDIMKFFNQAKELFGGGAAGAGAGAASKGGIGAFLKNIATKVKGVPGLGTAGAVGGSLAAGLLIGTVFDQTMGGGAAEREANQSEADLAEFEKRNPQGARAAYLRRRINHLRRNYPGSPILPGLEAERAQIMSGQAARPIKTIQDVFGGIQGAFMQGFGQPGSGIAAAQGVLNGLFPTHAGNGGAVVDSWFAQANAAENARRNMVIPGAGLPARMRPSVTTQALGGFPAHLLPGAAPMLPAVAPAGFPAAPGGGHTVNLSIRVDDLSRVGEVVQARVDETLRRNTAAAFPNAQF